MIKNSWLLTSIFLMLTLITNAQNDVKNYSDLEVSLKLVNPSREINDGVAKLQVQGGEAPYKYKWSQQTTALDSKESKGLIEGMEHTVIVTDATGKSTEENFTIPATSITEIFNSKVQPAVDFLGGVLFWDPFAAVGIYDPVVYSDKKEIPIPYFDATTKSVYNLKKWLVPEGESVGEGDKIAIVESDSRKEHEVYSDASGTIHYLVQEGGEIFNPNDKSDVIEQNAHMIAQVKFDEPQPLHHPNGDVRTNAIPFIVIWLILGSIFFTFRLGFVNIRGFKHSIQLAKGKFDNPDAPGTITHFQAMATAVSATVGLGNIAGVAVAISLGGAGATFWMFTAGFFAMSLKFTECTLGVKYREIKEDGRIFGGPMNYLRYGLEKRNMKGLGKFLAGLQNELLYHLFVSRSQAL